MTACWQHVARAAKNSVRNQNVRRTDALHDALSCVMNLCSLQRKEWGYLIVPIIQQVLQVSQEYWTGEEFLMGSRAV